MKINEDQKVTLTLGQLKRLIKESVEPEFNDALNIAYDRFIQEGIELGMERDEVMYALDLEIVSRQDKEDFENGTADRNNEYAQAVKWGYENDVDRALESNEFAYITVYEHPEDGDDTYCMDMYNAGKVIDKYYKEIGHGSFDKGYFKFSIFVDK